MSPVNDPFAVADVARPMLSVPDESPVKYMTYVEPSLITDGWLIPEESKLAPPADSTCVADDQLVLSGWFEPEPTVGVEE